MATPKPSKAARAATKAGRLNRNVTSRNIPEVRKSSSDLFKVLSKKENEAQAIELIKQYAMEADPSRPGYEGNEIIAPFVRAMSQLPNTRRLELLEKAGNPEIFRGLPNDIMSDILPDADFDEARMELELEAALGFGSDAAAKRKLPPQQNPTTFGGTDFTKSRANMDRAPIDREVSPNSKDPARARQQIIDGIIGMPAAQEYAAATGINPKTGEPPVDPITGFPMPEREPTLPNIRQRKQSEFDRLSKPRVLATGAGGPSKRAAEAELARVQGLPVDPSMEPLSHVIDPGVAMSREALDELKFGRPDVGHGGTQPLSAGVPQLESQQPLKDAAAALLDGTLDISSADPETRRIVAMSHMMQPPQFSDAAPTAVPSQEIKNNAIARIQAELAEIQRRRAAFEANPSDAPIHQREGMRPLMKGTFGLQGPYDPSKPHGMTVDQQLSQSTRSPADRLMEAIYRASEMMGASNDTDFGDYGKNDVRRLSDLAPAGAGESGLMPGEIDLRMLPEAWYRYPQVDPATGSVSYPDAAPTAEFLADQMVGWYGVEDAAEFKRRAIPVLEYSLRRQAPLGPSSMGAYKASATALRPNLGPSGGGRAFLNDPAFQEYAASRMFNPDVQMNRPPLAKAQAFGGGRPIRRPEAPEPTLEELNAMLDQPVVDPVDSLDAPPAGQPLEGLNDMDFLDRPVEGGDLDLSMNRMRRGPLSALIV